MQLARGKTQESSSWRWGKKIKEKRKRNAWGCGKGCQVKPSGGVKCGGN